MRYSKTGCTNGDVCSPAPRNNNKCEAAPWPQMKKGNP